MKNLLRRIVSRLLPAHLRRRWDIYLAPEDYYFLPKADLNYAEDNLFTFNAAPFLQDENFVRAYALAEQTGSWTGNTVRWRTYVACWAAQTAAKLPGDFVECGVNRGGLARAIVDFTGFQQLDKRFYLVDNFTGLVPEYLNAAEREKNLLEHYAYYEQNSEAEIAKTFADFPGVRVIRGNVPDVLPQIPTQSVAYVSLDMNCTMPEIKAAEHFWDQLVPGGLLLLDDYTQTLHSEQQIAFDHFAKERNVSVLALPTGQGLIMKPSLID